MRRKFLLSLLLLAAATASAYDFEVDGIYYNLNGNQATVTFGTNKYTDDVTIPSIVIYNGTTYSVTAIGERAFDNCRTMTSVTIPNSVISIGLGAFGGCSGLTSIAIPNSVTAIGEWAFSECSGLTSLTIPRSVISIGAGAFSSCDGLTSVTIPKSVTAIDLNPFMRCSNLMYIWVENGNPNYDSRGYCNAIIETASNTLITGCKNTVILGSVTAIGKRAFYYCTGLTSLIIPSSVTAIDEEAFEGCSGLTSMIIPNSVTSIGESAFSLCTELTSLTIGNSVTSIGNFAFSLCSELTSVDIPNSVTFIGYMVFSGCYAMTDIYSHITDLSNVSVASNSFSLAIYMGETCDYSGRTLHVPSGTLDAYQADKCWYPYFGQIVEMDPETGLIGDVNGDHEVTVADINAVIDIILGRSDYTTAADVNGDGEITIADVNAIIDIILHPAAAEQHEWVDLGLPSGTLWATCNIGANAPEEYGDYFAWGETEPKESYTWETYKWYYDRNGWPCCTKYCTNELDGTVDNKTELDPEDDAACVSWGPSWRMPTQRQIFELCDQCIKEPTTINDVQGIRFIGPNGNMLFLPLAGYYYKDTLNSANSLGYYWTRSLLESLSNEAHNLFISRYSFETWDYHDRYLGYTVRAVRVPQE